LADVQVVGDLVAALKVPINIVGRSGIPSVSRLEQIGVARVSIASGASLVAMSVTRQIAEELRAKGEFDVLKSSATRADAQHLFTPRPE
jgi:2-methylisocitrate lyase-like PEP mutase family enzyme